LPLHCFAQHPPLKQTEPAPHRQSAGQFAQFSPDWHAELPHTSASAHLKSVPHT
jgi:hypothetical protein